METCLKVLFLGSRDSAKYRIVLTARHYFGIGGNISNEVVPCSKIFCYLVVRSLTLVPGHGENSVVLEAEHDIVPFSKRSCSQQVLASLL